MLQCHKTWVKKGTVTKRTKIMKVTGKHGRSYLILIFPFGADKLCASDIDIYDDLLSNFLFMTNRPAAT